MLRILLGFCLLVALAGSIYLGVQGGAAGASLPGCGEGPLDCGHVLSSPFSRVFGVPVSWLAAVVYAMLAVAFLVVSFGGRSQLVPFCWYLLLIGAGVVGAAALWFTGLQIFQLKQYCLYCLTVHAAGVSASLLILITAPLARAMAQLEGPLRMRPAHEASVSAFYPAQPPRPNVEIHRVEIPLIGGFLSALAGTLLPIALAAGQIFVPQPSEPTYVIEVAEPSADSSDTAARAERERRELFDSISDERTVTPTKNKEGSNEDKLFPATGDKTDDTAAADSTAGKDDALDELLDHPAALDKAAKERWLSLARGKLFVNAGEHLRLGPLDAKHLLVKLFDYTCPHCRTMHRQLEEAQEVLGDRVALVLMPVPFEKKCNSRIEQSSEVHENACLYASLAIVVWRASPEKVPAFHESLMQGEHPPAPEDARERARFLIGPDGVEAARFDKTIGEYIEKCVDAYALLGAGRIPKLIIGDATMTGEARSGEELTKIIREHFGMEKESK